MKGSKIKRFFRDKHPVLNRHFQGLYAADQLKTLRLRDRQFVVVNTDRSLPIMRVLLLLIWCPLRLSGIGRHWYCIAQLNGCLGNTRLSAHADSVAQLNCNTASIFIEIFDPLGVTGETIQERWGKDHPNQGRRLYYNPSAVQPDFSVQCGWFCCYWVRNLRAQRWPSLTPLFHRSASDFSTQTRSLPRSSTPISRPVWQRTKKS
jgi:hypothetical protein